MLRSEHWENIKIMKKIIPIVVAVIVVGGICFYVGTKVGESSAVSARQAGSQSFRTGGGLGGGRTGGGIQSGSFTGGSIISKDDKSMTVSLQNGSSKIVLFSTSTSVMKTAQGTLNDLAAGEEVTVMGGANSDGSITAQSVQIRPNQPAPAAKNN